MRKGERRGHTVADMIAFISSKRKERRGEEGRNRERRFLLSTWLNLASRGAAARLTKINLFSLLLYLRGRNILATANECACVRGPPILTFAAATAAFAAPS